MYFLRWRFSENNSQRECRKQSFSLVALLKEMDDWSIGSLVMYTAIRLSDRTKREPIKGVREYAFGIAKSTFLHPFQFHSLLRLHPLCCYIRASWSCGKNNCLRFFFNRETSNRNLTLFYFQFILLQFSCQTTFILSSFFFFFYFIIFMDF